MDELEIEIINWEKYNGRQDVKNPTWFRMQNDLLFSYRRRPLKPSDIVVFLSLLSISSKKQTEKITISVRYLSQLCHIRALLVRSSISCLEENQMVRVVPRNVDVTPTSRPRTLRTDRQTDRQTDRKAPPPNNEIELTPEAKKRVKAGLRKYAHPEDG